MIAVIGGTGFYSFFEEGARTEQVGTPYGEPSAPITIGQVAGRDVAFLPRHGAHHEYAPHTVPYRANLWALRSVGVRRVFAPCAVGSLSAELGPGAVVVPDQLLDRTWGRPSTYFDGGGVHVSFADPYCPQLRADVISSGSHITDGGTMVIVQGPRFSTRAESQFYASAGATLINMTGAPEAILARELGLCYATVALVTDVDAGIEAGEGVRATDVFAEFSRHIGPLKELIRSAIDRAPQDKDCTACDPHYGAPLPVELP